MEGACSAACCLHVVQHDPSIDATLASALRAHEPLWAAAVELLQQVAMCTRSVEGGMALLRHERSHFHKRRDTIAAMLSIP